MTSTTAGMELINKWIEEKRRAGMPEESMDGTTFIYGDTLFQIRKTDNGKFAIESSPGKIVIFRDISDLDDEYTCRVCGTTYDNKIDTIRCCVNEEE